jgi:hypothetical protein
MKQILTFTLLLLTSFCYGQFAIVNDNDSLLNVREDGTTNSKVVDRLQNGHLIYCFEDKGNWTSIDYKKNNKELNGYVYKDRYKLISNFPALTITKKTETSLTFKKDTLQVIISQGNFDKKKHTFKQFKDNPTQIELIDNKKYWGMDGGMPRTQFEKVILKVGQNTITLPKSALTGLYEPSIYSAEVNYDKLTDTIYIQTMNSDGAGSYFVIWKIEKGIYKDRLIAYGF